LIVWGSFIVIITYMHTVYFGQVHPLHYISIPPPCFFKQCLVGFIMLSYTHTHTHTHTECTLILFTFQNPFLFPSSTLLLFYVTLHNNNIPFIIVVIVIIIILGIGSTKEWEHAIFSFLNLANLTQHYDVHFYLFSHKWHNVTSILNIILQPF
jgi:hypothetical protein